MKRDTAGVLFDIDNTLVPHGAPADERAKKLFARLKEVSFMLSDLKQSGTEGKDVRWRNADSIF